MSKHTPGPWVARRCGSGWAIDFNEDQEQVVDHVYEQADANLIAAAPDLLNACQQAREFLKSIANNTDELDALDAAIAKARGES